MTGRITAIAMILYIKQKCLLNKQKHDLLVPLEKKLSKCGGIVNSNFLNLKQKYSIVTFHCSPFYLTSCCNVGNEHKPWNFL